MTKELKGKAPLDPESSVGRFRMLSNDTEYEELSPPEEGFGSYKYASDAEIESYIEAASGNLNRALGTYFLAMSAAAAAEARVRSEEHTSELQSRGHLVCRLLLE